MQTQVNKIANYQYNFERKVFRTNCMLHLDSHSPSLCVCSAIFYRIDSIMPFFMEFYHLKKLKPQERKT